VGKSQSEGETGRSGGLSEVEATKTWPPNFDIWAEPQCVLSVANDGVGRQENIFTFSVRFELRRLLFYE
jgi:hypothetical protein